MKHISKIDEDDHGNESDTPLPTKKHAMSPSPFQAGNEAIRERKRGLSNVDIGNLRTFKVNTSAALQQEFDRVLKDRRELIKNPKNLNRETAKKHAKPKGKGDNNHGTKRAKLYLNGEKIKPKNDPFKNFDFFGGGSPRNNNDQVNLNNQKDHVNNFDRFNTILDRNDMPDLKNVRNIV